MIAPATLPEELRQFLDAGRFAQAEEQCRRLLPEAPHHPALWFALGVACQRQGKSAQAIESFSEAARLDPRDAQVLAAKAAVLLEAGRAEEALQACREALAIGPEIPQLHVNLGVVHEHLGDIPAALSAYDASLAIEPAFSHAMMNRGVVLTRLGRLDEALDNNRRLAERWPDVADFHFNCAEVLLALGRSTDALMAADRAAELSPGHVKAQIDRGLALSELGRFAEAQAAFDRARALDAFGLNRFLGLPVDATRGEPLRVDPRAIYLERTFQRLTRCDWTGRDEYLANFSSFVLEAPDRALDAGLMPLAYHALTLPLAPEVQLIVARRLADGFSQRAAAHGPLLGPRSSGQRIRLGYMSPDFRIHPVGLLTQDLFRLHDRSRFEVIAYSLAPDDGSDVRRKIVAGVDAFREVAGLSDEVIARRVADDGIDVFVDLAGYTDLARSPVFARRPAGIQVNYLGFAGSLGAEYMDYAIVDAVTCPAGSERYWVEKLVRLPTVFAPSGGSEVPVHPGRQRRELGLPDAGCVFCSFANAYKIDPSIFGTWMRILERVPRACLWLMQSHPDVPLNLRREAQSRGIDPERLLFVAREPLPGYLARYQLADLFLDTRWFNAHTTAMDALRCGVPVLTIAGGTMASRLAASVLSALDLPELIADTLQQYEENAVSLALAPGRLDAVREKLKRNRHRSPLFDLGRRVRELEAAYAEMFVRRQKGLAPEPFAVAPQPAGLPLF